MELYSTPPYAFVARIGKKTHFLNQYVMVIRTDSPINRLKSNYLLLLVPTVHQ